MPVDRETGRPRGFAFVEFADRAVAEDVIRKFDAQPFQGRNLAVSEARAREDRPAGRSPAGRLRRSARPEAASVDRVQAAAAADSAVHARAASVHVPAAPVGLPGPGGRDRSANFGPPAPPKRLRGKKGNQQDHKPRGPIKERTGGRSTPWTISGTMPPLDIDDIATKRAGRRRGRSIDESSCCRLTRRPIPQRGWECWGSAGVWNWDLLSPHRL